MHSGKKDHTRAKKSALVAPKPGLRGRVWIDGPEGTFFGYGRAVLLERIIEHGSITRAARSMDMAYRHAWDLVDSMNRQAREPFVEVATGGKGGGGARVTKEGEHAVKLFWQFHEDFHEFLKREEKKLKPAWRARRKTGPKKQKI